MRQTLTLSFAFLCACAGDGRGKPPSFDEVERLVLVGDNLAQNPTSKTSYPALLLANDDALFPDFAGKDLAHALPGLDVVRLDRGGDSYRAVADNLESLCTCFYACEERCLSIMDSSATLLIVQLGVNDLASGALQLINDDDLRADPTPLIEEVRAAVRKVLAWTQRSDLFPRPPLVYVVNIYDPSDGVGDIPQLAAEILPLPSGADEVTPEQVLTLVQTFDTLLHEEAERIGATVVDVRTPFLGHGLHHDDVETPSYDAEDPTRWIRGFLDPNLRGAHELRRALWHSLTGELVTAIPQDLPADGTLEMPPVPDEGWAKAVVSSTVPETVDVTGLGVVPNIDADAEMAIGIPDGEGVALGGLGSYVILDFGASGVAQDGEGDDVVILEFGTLSGGVPEPYRASAASDAAGPFVELGDGAGERSFDLGAVGLESARYIKIESLVQPYDLGHVGSPFAPGPEIDAVGAVYPAL